jgi:hypothetical protein
MRTIIDFPKDQRAWLAKKAKEKGVSVAEAARQALREVQEAEQKHAKFMSLIKKVQGTWTNGDGLAWQQKMRAEWDH